MKPKNQKKNKCWEIKIQENISKNVANHTNKIWTVYSI